MTRIRRINVSQVEGGNADNAAINEIRPNGETAFYLDNNNKLTLMMFDGVRTHLKSKVLSPGVVYGSNADSGDGLGYDTIKLIPDATLGSDQYIVVDPTGGDPGHIHLRAGGLQDQSGADLYLGGELTFVRVSDTSDDVVIRTNTVGEGYIPHSWTFNNDGNLILPNDAVIRTDGSNVEVGNVTNFNVEAAGVVNIYTDTSGENPYQWQFGNDGKFSAPEEVYGNFFTLRGGQAPGNSIGTLGYGGDIVVLNGLNGVKIESGAPESGPIWGFGTDGKTTFPSNKIKTPSALSIETPTGIPTAISNINSSGSWDQNPTSGLIATGGSGVGLTVNVTDFESGYAGTITIDTAGTGYTDGDTITITSGNSSATFTITVPTNTWTFGSDGGLTFPDNTVQTTAYVAADNVAKVSGTWTVTTGTNDYSFTVPVNGVYQLWVRANIANGIVSYTATAAVTNSNVPVLGTQYAWNYTGAGNPILFTTLPTQFIGTEGAISTANPSVGTSTNTFVFGLQNNTAEDVTVEYGYTKIS